MYNSHFDQTLNIPQQLFISNKRHIIRPQITDIIFPFYWEWNYINHQLTKMYIDQFKYYNFNQLLFNHSFLFDIRWDIIEYIREKGDILNNNNTGSGDQSSTPNQISTKNKINAYGWI